MKRPLSPSALTAAAAVRSNLTASNGSSGTASPASPTAAASRSAHVSAGSSTAMMTTATTENDDDATSTKLHAQLRYRTRSVVAMLLCVVCVTVPFITWNLTIGRGPLPPTYRFHQCNDTDVISADTVTCCNGLSEICDLPVNEVLFATVHNAHSSREDFFLRPNHRYGIDQAMEHGYRAFLLDVCSCPPIGLVFCHGICAVGTVSTDKVLGSVRQFLLDNPNEVILLEFQMHSADVDWLFALQDIIVEVGLGDMVHVHGGGFFADWATMRELIETNERLILFQHNGPYCWPPPVCPEMLHTFHWYAVETSYSVKGTNNLLRHNNQSCTIIAGWNATMKFLLVNHFAGSALGLPKLQNAKHLNQRDVLEERIATCTEYLGMKPNLVAIDFWSIGDLPAVVQEQNRMRALDILSQRNDDDARYAGDDDADDFWG